MPDRRGQARGPAPTFIWPQTDGFSVGAGPCARPLGAAPALGQHAPERGDERQGGRAKGRLLARFHGEYHTKTHLNVPVVGRGGLGPTG